MHVRIGYGIGAVPMLMGTPDGFGTVVDDLGQPHTGGDQHAARKEQRGDGPSEGP